MSVFQRTHLGSLLEKEIERGQGKEMNEVTCPCIYLFIVIYCGFSAETVL